MSENQKRVCRAFTDDFKMDAVGLVTNEGYQRSLKTLGITCSMSRTGCCYDNAVIERFFWSLKHEWTNSKTFADLSEARASVFEYIETFYNSVRIHQTLGCRTPDQFEDEHQKITDV